MASTLVLGAISQTNIFRNELPQFVLSTQIGAVQDLLQDKRFPFPQSVMIHFINSALYYPDSNMKTMLSRKKYGLFDNDRV